MTHFVEMIKKLFYRLLLYYKYLNQNIYSWRYLNKVGKKVLTAFQTKETKVFWNKYTRKFNIDYTRYYTAVSGTYSKYYIPDSLYYSYIDMYFNNSTFSPGLDIKAFYEIINPNLKMAKTAFRKLNGICYNNNYQLIKEVEYLDQFEQNHEYIYKPAFDSQGGRGILFLKSKDINKDLINNNNNFIIQEVVQQHETLSKLHPSSLNTIRITSFFFKGKIHILSSVLRMGVSGSRVDNASKGEIVVGIDINGKLKKLLITVIIVLNLQRILIVK